ncbi:hypothetical protein F4780DRAFT_644142 [Xylariomycetidae sp. FL0641]|nr:hypothetical protein F4780DRAFT_644142 [Xylariomycetidae sp. FL0641]
MAARFATASRLLRPSARPQLQNQVKFASLQSPLRTQMASITTPPPGQYEWLVVVPDKPGMQQKRLEVRPKHFEGLEVHKKSGKFKTGGAILNDKPESEDPSAFDFYGSTLVCVAASKQEVYDLLAKDIYTTSGVWDLEKAKIAFRYP